MYERGLGVKHVRDFRERGKDCYEDNRDLNQHLNMEISLQEVYLMLLIFIVGYMLSFCLLVWERCYYNIYFSINARIMD